jgi:predicted RNA binding protein YcfA (HicA-like mRNA interferase family)
MPRKLRELRCDLRRSGWYIDRQKGSHQTWRHSLLPGDKVTLAGHDGADAHDYQEDEVREAVADAKKAQVAQQTKGHQKP